jgi:2-methylcitrate dehydratase PrpD
MVSGKRTNAELLADFVYRTDYDDLPEDAIQMSRRIILDQLGDELACSGLDWNKKVLKYVQDLEIASDESTILSYGVRSSAEYAAFVNATFGHGFEVDDFNPVATAHPGCVAVPAALSVGEREHLSGQDLLAGVALASEVITRVGASGMVFGASAVAGKMLGLDPERIAYGMSIAGSHASGTTEFALTGGDVKRVHAGVGANGGIRSALLAQIGLAGPLTILEDQHGVLLTERLGDHYVFLTNGFRPYCCAIDIHRPIEALTRVIKAHSLGPKDIAEIGVPAARPVKPDSGVVVEPRDLTGAQLSMHYSLALTVCKKSNNFDTYVDALRSDFKDPEVLEVARKVSIVEVPDLDSRGETPVPGDLKTPPLTVQAQDGTTYTEELLPAKGSPQNPMTDKELEGKFMGLATRVMPEEQAAKIAATVRNLETIKDLCDLTELLVSPSLLRSGARWCLHAEQATSKEGGRRRRGQRGDHRGVGVPGLAAGAGIAGSGVAGPGRRR